MNPSFVILPEREEDAAAILRLHEAAFGPGAYARAAFRVREQAPHDPRFSFVGAIGNMRIASVRQTHVEIGFRRGLLLGPLVVDPPYKNAGYGRALLRHGLTKASEAEIPFVILVGDEPYYGPFGFSRAPAGRIAMPGPVDAGRLLVAELQPGAAAELAGMVRGVQP